MTSWIIFNCVAESWPAPIRLAGTCNAYSGKAISQLTRMANGSQALRYFKWPYQATVMKVFEQIKSAIVFTTMPSRIAVPPLPRTKFQEPMPSER